MASELPNPEEPMPEGEEPPPPGVKTMAIVRWVILGVSILVALFVWGAYARERWTSPATTANAPEGPKYHCPMHPQIVSNEPGECPICHMDLVLISSERAAPASSMSKPLVIVDDAGPLTHWCPMDPEVRSAKPGRCPVCKMALEPIPPGTATTVPAMPSSPPGTVPIVLALDRIQAIGVRTALVEEGPASSGLRVTAIVREPEHGAAEVHVRSPGFVEAIHVDQTGKQVSAGQPLLALYSAELLQAQHELLLTRSWAADASSPSLASPARARLELFGMTSGEIDRVLTKREPVRAIAIVAPRAGYVTKKNVVLGSYVTPETVLYEIQDLSRVYVVGDVFLRDLPFVAVGTEARFVPTGRADGVATAKIDLVYPVVDVNARTRRVRMQISNEGGKKYAPGEYGILEVQTAQRRALTIPRDALIDTGTATYVFLAEPNGRFVPRSVVTSRTAADSDRFVVDSGLVPGERVVSGATFLIDSESRLQASIAGAKP